MERKIEYRNTLKRELYFIGRMATTAPSKASLSNCDLRAKGWRNTTNRRILSAAALLSQEANEINNS